MKRSRTLHLVALKENIAMQHVRREAGKLRTELDRLDARIAQIDDLLQSYNEHLALPDLRTAEFRDTRQIMARLGERKEIDNNRREILVVERDRLAGMLGQMQRKVTKLEEEGVIARRHERDERDALQESLMPERRN